MADALYVSQGQINGAGDTKALYEKIATGEILAAFAKTTEFSDKQSIRTIAKGKSAEFVVTGRKNAARYHTPGTEVLGSDFKQAARVITIDDMLITDHFVADIDEAMSSYDIRSEITTKMGEDLAQAFDRNSAQVAVLAARASATVTGGSGGSRLVSATMLTSSDVMADAFFDAAAAMDDKYVPSSERYGFVRSAQYYALARNTKVLNKDWDGSGSYSQGKVKMIAEITLVKTPNLPSTNIATGNAKYQGNFTTTAGLIMHKTAIGTVKLLEMNLQSEYQLSRLGSLMIAKYAVGHDYLRPECAVELATA